MFKKIGGSYASADEQSDSTHGLLLKLYYRSHLQKQPYDLGEIYTKAYLKEICKVKRFKLFSSK